MVFGGDDGEEKRSLRLPLSALPGRCCNLARAHHLAMEPPTTPGGGGRRLSVNRCVRGSCVPTAKCTQNTPFPLRVFVSVWPREEQSARGSAALGWAGLGVFARPPRLALALALYSRAAPVCPRVREDRLGSSRGSSRRRGDACGHQEAAAHPPRCSSSGGGGGPRGRGARRRRAVPVDWVGTWMWTGWVPIPVRRKAQPHQPSRAAHTHPCTRVHWAPS